MGGGLVHPQNLILTVPQLQLREESSFSLKAAIPHPSPPKKAANQTALAFQHIPLKDWGAWMGGEAICHSPQGAGDSGSHLEPAEMTTLMAQYPLQRRPGGLLFQVTKVRKSQSPPPLLPPLCSATHLGSMITEFVLNRSERLT